MVGRPRAYLRFLSTTIGLNLRAAMAYRVSFATSVLFMAANDLMWIAFWALFFHRFPVVRGWQIRDLVTAWAVVATGFGLATALFGNCGWQGTRVIVEGRLDYHLSLPKNPLLHFLVSSSNVTAWGDALFGIGSFAILVRPDPWHIALFICFAVCASTIFVACGVLLNSLAFWAGNTESLANQVMSAVITFGTYPLDLFGLGVKVALFTVIPSAFIAYLPVRVLREFDPLLTGAVVAFTAGLLGLALLVWRAGLRRYESGSLVTMRG